jgi:hypothetical protein
MILPLDKAAIFKNFVNGGSLRMTPSGGFPPTDRFAHIDKVLHLGFSKGKHEVDRHNGDTDPVKNL